MRPAIRSLCTVFALAVPLLAQANLDEVVARTRAAFKVPGLMHLSQQALPRNAAGKLLKSDLRKVFA